jgi:vitamin B12 transporter
MKSKGLMLLLVFAVLVLAAPLAAQEEEPKEEQPEEEEAPAAAVSEEVFVTATRIEASRETLGSSTTSVDSQQIEETRKTTVPEVLRTVPGLEITQSGGPGTVVSAFLRGASPGQTLILVDGVRANSVTSGGTDLSGIRLDNVERIEVVRGPQSTLYGSEAIGGVINIITRRGEPGLRTGLRLEGGKNGFLSAAPSVSGGNARWDYSAVAAYEETDGISAASERAGNTEDDAYDNSTLSGRLGFAFLEDGRMDLNVRAFEASVELDGFAFGVGPVDDLNYVQDRDVLFASFQVDKPLTRRWNQNVRLSRHQDDFTGKDPDSPFNNFNIDNRATEIDAQSDFQVTDDQILTFGFSHEEREGSSAGDFDEQVDLGSVFLQHQVSWNDRVFLTGGARYDDHSKFGSETTYRLTAAVVASRATRLHGSYGTGFRAPSLNELFFPFFGNPDLLPETSRGFDLGVEQGLFGDRAKIDVTWFDNEFEDLIGFDFATFLANNIAEAETHGVEVLVEVDPSPLFDVTASYTYTESENLTTGLQLPRRPKTRGTLLLAFRPAEWTGTLSLVVVKDRIDSDAAQLDDYERVDVSLSYRLNERLVPYVRVENLLDEDYEEIRGFTSPGITPAAGVSLSF